MFSVCTHQLYYNSGQSLQGWENMAVDHTLDHLMGQEAAAEAGVIAEAEVTAGAWVQVLATLGEQCCGKWYFHVFIHLVCWWCTLDSECEYFVSLVERICRGFLQAYDLLHSYAIFDYNSSIELLVKLSFDLSHIIFTGSSIVNITENFKRLSWIRVFKGLLTLVN